MRSFLHYKCKRNRQSKRAGCTTTISQLYCCECGTKMFVPRNVGQQREELHLKHMFCVHCRKTTAHLEVREFDTPMPAGYYIRHKLKLDNDVLAYHTADFWLDDHMAVLIYIYSKAKPNTYMVYDIAARSILRNTGFPKEVSASYTKILSEMKDTILDKARNCLAA